MATAIGNLQLAFTTFDVFTSQRYHGGNPLAIVHIPAHISRTHAVTAAQKQLIGREFNLSEIVFLHEDLAASTDHDGNPIAPTTGTAKIDIFTSYKEVPFAGHPTIGTSNYILRYLANSSDPKVAAKWKNVDTILTRAGPLSISLANFSNVFDSSSSQGVKLKVAHNVHTHRLRLSNPQILARFGQAYRENFTDDEIATFPIVSSVKVKPLRDLMDPGWQTGILTTYFFVDLGFVEIFNAEVRMLRTRMFGSREDPATGSAASALCGWLSLTEKNGGKVRRYRITQGVEMGRRCEIDVEVILNDEEIAIETLTLSGTAAKVMEGVLNLPSPSEKS